MYRNLFGSLYVKMSVSYIVIIAILVAAISAASGQLFFRKMEDELSRKHAMVLEQLKENVDHFIVEATDKMIVHALNTDENVLKLLHADTGTNGTNMGYIRQVYDKLKNLKGANPFYHSIYIYFHRPQVVVTNFGTYMLSETVDRSRDFAWLTKADTVRERWALTSFRAHPTSATESRVITRFRTYPAYAERGSEMTVAVHIDADKLYEQLSVTANTVFGDIFIVDAAGNVLFHNIYERMFQRVPDEQLLADIRNEHGTRAGMDASSRNERVYYTRSSVNDWVYINVMPLGVYDKDLRDMRRAVYMIAFAALAVFVVISLFWAKRLYRPFGELVAKSKRISRELFHAGDVSYQDDKTLGQTLNRLVTTVEQLQLRIGADQATVKSDFLRKLFERRFRNDEDVVMSLNKLNLEFPYARYYCAYVEFLLPKRMLDVVTDIHKSNLMLYVEHVDAIHCIRLAADMHEDGVAVLLNADHDDAALRFVHEMIRYGRKRLPFRFAVGFGEGCGTLAELHRSFSRARDAVKYAFVHPDRALFEQIAFARRDADSHAVPPTFCRKLVEDLNEGNEKSAVESLNRLFQELSSEQYSFAAVQSELLLLHAALCNFCRSPVFAGGEPDALDAAKAAPDIREARRLYEQICLNLIRESRLHRDNKSEGEMERVREYVRQMIERKRSYEITLTEVAEHFHIHPNYLSTLFADKIGMNFKDYVVAVKLECAEQALRRPNVKIKDVASDLGYDNIGYFIRIFKRKFGMTPKEYANRLHRVRDIRMPPSETK